MLLLISLSNVYYFEYDLQIAHKPSIYVLDTPGVLVPSIPDIETGLKLSLAGLDLFVSFLIT